ncbi:MAG: aminopeptidase P family protein [Clostridia bacterium]|nr:aminopeptidase P family protein [Clostridia bacterium]
MTRLEKIASMLRQKKYDALLLTCAEHIGGESMQYATGMNGLEGMALITAKGEGYCFTDSRYIEAAQKIVGANGLRVEMPQKKYHEVAAELAASLGLRCIAFEDRVMTYAEYQVYAGALPCGMVASGDALTMLRAAKTDDEVESIVAAQRIAERAFDEVLGLVAPGKTESELAAELEYRMRRHGAQGLAFSTIFVSGANSSLPHGVPGDKKLQRGDFVTVDFGARVNGYCSDMTRTFAIGEATDEMRRVYETVLEAQLAGIAALEVGKTGHEVDKAARDVIEHAGYGAYFGHGLGHSVGLHVHDPGPRAAKGSEACFSDGNIITMEPGIYLPGRFGVRIEDMILVKADGNRNLTACPKALLIL